MYHPGIYQMLTIGTRLGSYEIVALLGAGGMGEVYRAKDAKLGREVALKLLPATFTHDAERLARFRREAQVLASLNHPHIGAIYGVDEANGQQFLVLELVDGETLDRRVARGPIPIDEALPIAKQIAEALEAAHEKGIIHRDLKPSNIAFTADGQVKVLDFGLAKLTAPELAAAGSGGLSHSPTITSPAMMTGMGVLLGTAAYMSPEQAKGKPADHRSDIWAFGCVVYEMLVGKPAFEGETLGEILGSVFKSSPDWNRLAPDTPPAVKRLLVRCLSKDPRTRLHSSADAILDIQEALSTASDQDRRGVSKTGRVTPALTFAVAVLAMAFGATAATAWFMRTTSTGSVTRIVQVAAGDQLEAPQVSGDGNAVAFVRNGKLAVRELDRLEVRELDGTTGASNPFWSPDGMSIGYFAAGNRLHVISREGGASRLIASDVFAPWGGSWCPRGLVFGRFGRGLWIASDAGQPQQIARLDDADGQTNLAYPYCLNDGRVLAVVRRGDGNRQGGNADLRSIIVIDGDRRSTLFEWNDWISWPVFVEPNSVLFERRGGNAGIWKLSVTADLSAVTGPPIRVLAEAARPSISANGILASLGGTRQSDRELLIIDRKGNRMSTFGKPQPNFSNPSISPDGRRIAVASSNDTTSNSNTGARDVWIHYDAAFQRLAAETTDNADPAWSPIGDLIAYVGRKPDRTFGLFVQSSSGVGGARLIAEGPAVSNPAWAPDGQSLVYQGEDDTLWLVALAKGESPKLLLKRATEPTISPDGRLIAFTSDVGSRPEIYVTTFPTPSAVLPVSSDAGRYPRWNPRGGELFFASGAIIGDDPNSRRGLAVVKIQPQNPMKVGQPEQLFDAEMLAFRLSIVGVRGYDIFPDGQHVVVLTSRAEGTPSITLIENVRRWMEREH